MPTVEEIAVEAGITPTEAEQLSRFAMRRQAGTNPPEN